MRENSENIVHQEVSVVFVHLANWLAFWLIGFGRKYEWFVRLFQFDHVGHLVFGVRFARAVGAVVGSLLARAYLCRPGLELARKIIIRRLQYEGEDGT